MKNKPACIIPMSVLMFCICLSCSSTAEPEEPKEFAIFVVELSPTIITQLNDLELIKEPLLTTSDITSYKWENHYITYPESVYERLKAWGHLLNRGFVVTVDNQRIYMGGFRNSLSSAACSAPVINLGPECTIDHSIYIGRYYVSPPEPDEPDPRIDPRIYKALEEAGILIP